jgi:hypothetical protein
MGDIVLDKWWKTLIYIIGWIDVIIFLAGFIIGLIEGFLAV